MNKIILIGNLTRDPETGSTQGGVEFTRFTIAVNRPFTNAAGERVPDYFDVICWRQLAERCGKYLFKGSKIGVNGWVQRRQYEDRNRIKRTAFEVVADEVEFLSQKQSGENTPSNQRNNTEQSARENRRTARQTGDSGQNNGIPDDLIPVSPIESDDLPF